MNVNSHFTTLTHSIALYAPQISKGVAQFTSFLTFKTVCVITITPLLFLYTTLTTLGCVAPQVYETKSEDLLLRLPVKISFWANYFFAHYPIYSSTAQFNLSYMYFKGIGTNKDIPQGNFYFQKSLEQNYLPAINIARSAEQRQIDDMVAHLIHNYYHEKHIKVFD